MQAQRIGPEFRQMATSSRQTRRPVRPWITDQPVTTCLLASQVGDDEMPAEWEYSVAFRVNHPSADSAAIAKSLGWKARWAWRAGEPRRDGAGRPLPGNYKNSYCTFSIRTSRRVPLAELFRRALYHLAEHRALLSELVATGGRLEFFTGIYVTKGTGDDIDHSILLRCGELGINLALLVSPFKMPDRDQKSVNVLPAPGRRRPGRR